MRLDDLNALEPSRAEREFLRCCGSTRWARAMVAARPFVSSDSMVDRADHIWTSLDAQDWLEALAAHPRIGDSPSPRGRESRLEASARGTREREGASEASGGGAPRALDNDEGSRASAWGCPPSPRLRRVRRSSGEDSRAEAEGPTRIEEGRTGGAGGESWSDDEQAGTRSAGDDVRDRLAEANRNYERRFGYIFIVCATGKSAEEMLAILESRLPNSPEAELRIAAEEQRKITRLRLDKLLVE